MLGSVLRDNAVLSDILNVIRPDNFYFDAHQKLFQAHHRPVQRRQAGRSGHPLRDAQAEAAARRRRRRGYLADLWDAAPTAANAEYYARIVRDKAIVRNLIHASTELLRDAYDGITSADELLGMAERKILEIAEKGTTGETHTLEDDAGRGVRPDRRSGPGPAT